MALPDYAFFESGTSITYTSSGGDKVITLTSLPNGSGYQGAKSATLVDGTKGMPAFLDIRIEIKPTSAPTDGTSVDLFIGESDNSIAASGNPGSLTGSDGSLVSPNECKRQLKYGGSLILSNSLGAVVQTSKLPRYYVTSPYIIPVIQNNGGVALSSTGTDHRIVFTPYYRKLVD